MVRRILQENPNVEYHVWNFARNDADRAYVKTIEGERITVFNGTGEGLRTSIGGLVIDANGFESPIPTAVEGAKQFGAGEHNAAYKHYSDPSFKDHLFMKVDDDIVFLETARFSQFIKAIDTHRDSVCIANIINNGAATPVTPAIWDAFQKMKLPLLDIHLSNDFADMVHTYMFEHHDEILNQPVELIPTEDWTSINCVGYAWPTLAHVRKTIGQPQPSYLAGRPMHGWGRTFGDEGVFQTLPRIIVKGFTAAHLTFGPQDKDQKQLTAWRKKYRKLGEDYLGSDLSVMRNGAELPELSEVSCGYVGIRLNDQLSALTAKWGPTNWRTRALLMDENDPLVGRYRS